MDHPSEAIPESGTAIPRRVIVSTGMEERLNSAMAIRSSESWLVGGGWCRADGYYEGGRGW